MAGLEKFGITGLAEAGPRGPVQRIGSRLEVHRAGPKTFHVQFWGRSKTTGDPYFRQTPVPMAAVQELWAAIRSIIDRGGNTVHTPDLTPRQVMAELLARLPDDSPLRLLSVDEAQGGTARSAFYMPRYYYPLLVLRIHYRAIDHHGRSLRIVKEGFAW